MVNRIVYGAASILFLLVLFLLDIRIAGNHSGVEGAWNELLARGILLPLFVLVTVLAAGGELQRLLATSGAFPHSKWALFMIGCMILAPWLSAAGWLGTEPAEVEGLYWEIVLLIIACVGSALLSLRRGAIQGCVRDLGATGLMIVYLGFLPSFALQLRCGRDVPDQSGAALLLMTLLVTKSSDIGAYLVGSTLGKHKLFPVVSPNKSVEGAIAGIVTSVLVAVLFAQCATWRGPGAAGDPGFDLDFFGASQAGELSTLLRSIIFGASMSVLGQVGDLIESCFKRDAEIKDSGAFLPTFGGILDLIDSPVLALPVAWFLLTAVWRVV